VTAAIDREIRIAYIQLAFVCLLVLLGALVGAEKLIIGPIEVMTGMARRFGEGDWSARVARRRLPSEFIPLARAFNAMAAQLSQRERELVATNDRLTVMASIDMLSGLANRRGLQSRLDFEWLKAQQYNSELALLMIDVDHFKAVNDEYGHAVGDRALRAVADILRANTRVFDSVARYGGEEFVVVMPGVGLNDATVAAERLRAAIETTGFAWDARARYRLTVSVGVASKGEVPGTPEALLHAADLALYAAKRGGRNRVEIAAPVEPGAGAAT
jgi:diguanylate cyclase (GGDEF)-like protein